MPEGLLTRTRRRPSLCTGYSDPFLVVYNGSKKQNKINDEANALKDTLNPQFYKCFELPTLIPGNPLLKIEVWDKDSDGAQLIGSTEIDVENRLFSQEWNEMEPKPVERRYLWSPCSLAPQGKLELWLELLSPPQALAAKPKLLHPPTALECELRVVVWSVRELVLRDKSKAISDAGYANVFVTVCRPELPGLYGGSGTERLGLLPPGAGAADRCPAARVGRARTCHWADRASEFQLAVRRRSAAALQGLNTERALHPSAQVLVPAVAAIATRARVGTGLGLAGHWSKRCIGRVLHRPQAAIHEPHAAAEDAGSGTPALRHVVCRGTSACEARHERGVAAPARGREIGSACRQNGRDEALLFKHLSSRISPSCRPARALQVLGEAPRTKTPTSRGPSVVPWTLWGRGVAALRLDATAGNILLKRPRSNVRPLRPSHVAELLLQLSEVREARVDWRWCYAA